MPDYELRLAFDTDDPEFARGFEAGRLDALLQTESVEQTFTIHASNAEMAMRIAESHARPFRANDLGEEWVDVWFGEVAS